MALTDILKINQFKSEIEDLRQENENLNHLLTPEMKDATKLQQHIRLLQANKNTLNKEIANLQCIIFAKKSEINSLDQTISSKKDEVIQLDDSILYQEFGLYAPVYNLVSSDAYKARLEVVRTQQKDCIKRDTVCSYPTTFTLDGSLSKGKALVKDNVKQIIRSFNNECDAVIDKVKFNNIESVKKKIEKSFIDLNKMNKAMKIEIRKRYLDLKLEELNLCYEYAIKKQEEKEEQKAIREQLREETKLQKELEEARKNINKEQTHYQNALNQLELQISSASANEKPELLRKKLEINERLIEIGKSIESIDYRESNKRAGYVYVISNIGAFGENVYKIGMTRRLEPVDRVDELGDASVPFNFDIHAMIFSDDAPSLENALHKAFETKKLNMVNQRREFFHVTLAEIEAVVKKNFDKTVEFTRIPAAEQYRESQMIRTNNNIPTFTNDHLDINASPADSTSNTNEDDVEYIYTKWGKYPCPNPYKINFARNYPPKQ